MYRFMDSEELEINQINNLKMIHIYDLAGVSGGVTSMGTTGTLSGTISTQEAPRNHVNAIAVYYDDNKQKNLCVMDKHYNLLVERVLKLYSRCEQKDAIMMDPSTKALIEEACKGIEENISPITRLGKKYSDCDGEDIPRYNKDAYIRMATIPIIKYYLSELYSMLDMEIQFKEDVLGWQGNTVLTAKTDKDEKKMPVKYSFENNSSFSVTVGNFLKDKCNITFQINYKPQSIEITFVSEDADIVGNSSYSFGYSSAISRTSIKVNDVTVYYQELPALEVNKDTFEKDYYNKLLDIDLSTTKVYELPWKAYYFSSLQQTETSNICRTDFNTGYIDSNVQVIFARQYAWSDIVNQQTGLNIKTSGVMMERVIPDKADGLLQTTFLPVGYYSGWDYKNRLENKYFYEEIKEK